MKGRGGRETPGHFFNETIKLLDYYDNQKKLIVVNAIRVSRKCMPNALHTDPSHGDTEERRFLPGKYHLPRAHPINAYSPRII